MIKPVKELMLPSNQNKIRGLIAWLNGKRASFFFALFAIYSDEFNELNLWLP